MIRRRRKGQASHGNPRRVDTGEARLERLPANGAAAGDDADVAGISHRAREPDLVLALHRGAGMKTNRISALVALLIAALGGTAVAEPGAARPVKTRAMGTFKGTVTVKSSAAIPGLVPRERKSVMTLSMTRRGNQVELEIHDPDGLGPGRPLTSKDKGRICCVKRAPKTAIVDLEFDGPEFKSAVEERVNAGMSHLAVAKGMKVELSDARNKATVSLKGDKVTFSSNAIVVRKPVRGLRGRLLEAVTPREMTLEFTGELTRQPTASAHDR